MGRNNKSGLRHDAWSAGTATANAPGRQPPLWQLQERAPRVLSRIVLNPISRFSPRFSCRIIPVLVRFTSFQNPQKRAPRPLLLSHLRRASDKHLNYAVRKTRRAASLAWPGGGIHSASCVPGRPWASNGSFLRLLDFPSVCPGLLRLPLWLLLASLLILCLALWSAATSGADVRCLPRGPPTRAHCTAHTGAGHGSTCPP